MHQYLLTSIVKLLEKSNIGKIISEAISEGILVVDDRQTIVASNTAANQMFGYPKEGLNGKPLKILIPKTIRSQHKTMAHKFIQTGKRRPMGAGLDLIGVRKNGDEFPMEISLNPFTLWKKKYVIGLVVDSTEQRKAEQTIDHWYRIFNESLNEIYVFDAQSLVFINVNYGGQRNLGYTMEELSQMTALDIKPEYLKDRVTTLLKPLLDKTKEKVEFETMHQRKDGSTYPVEVHLQRSAIGQREVLVAIVWDITERKNYTQRLESTVEERTLQLREALQAEKRLNGLKTKFLSLVSHEFKTPLASILTSTALLAKYTEADQQEKRDKHLYTITSKVKYLNNILNDFLSIERLDSGKVNYTLTTFPLSKLINEVIYDANTLLKEGQHIQQPEHIDEITVTFDEKIITLTLSNLIRNAIKYSPEGSCIALKVDANPTQLQIHVTDQGFGIPQEDQPFIFNRYFRASNVLTIQGTGIGLNTIQQHLQNLNADIRFKSTLGQGSTFTVSIPIKASEHEKSSID